MLTPASIDTLIATLARGDGEGARHYLRHFAYEDRKPERVREELAKRTLPAHMAIFEQTAPWLLDTGDDTPARIREAIAESGAVGLSLTEVGQRVRRVPVDKLREHLDRMVTARELVIAKKPTKGRPAEVFRLYEHGAGVQPSNWRDDPYAYRPGPFVPDVSE